MSLRLLLPGAVLLVLLLSACAPPPDLRDDNLLDDTGLVSGEPCEAPCWRGITPGETAWRDALAVVTDAEDFTEPEVQTDEATGAIGAVWSPVDGTQCCQMVAEDGQTVNLVFLRTAPVMDVEELFEAQGEPTYAVGTPFSEDQAIINLIYPDIPIIVFAFVAGEGGSLSESSDIIGVLYTTPADMELFLQTNNLHEWEGLESYATYDSAEGADFEITPSVTLTPAE